MTFGEYLLSKKIDEEAFAREAQDVFQAWKNEFDRMHPASFTARHLFQINGIRRRFRLRPAPETTPATAPVAAPAGRPKPVLRPKTP